MDAKAGKNPHAVALGRLGGKKGGVVRATRMTPEERSASARNAAIARMKALKPAERSEIAKKAVQARWKNQQIFPGDQ